MLGTEGRNLTHGAACNGHTRALGRWGGQLGGGKERPAAWLGTPRSNKQTIVVLHVFSVMTASRFSLEFL